MGTPDFTDSKVTNIFFNIIKMYAPYKYNKAAKYTTGPYYYEKAVDLTKLTIAVAANVHFETIPHNIFNHYLTPDITSDFLANQWLNNGGMQFFQNQINFAVSCATTGCRVSYGGY